ncbi:probable magnesium transporter NIPA9 isoform X2 [Phalaenopsis equestris]|uniref:probable magnesium transporter NIPA9 isoform X2 n=1 Tax=Phalaenopsis equestris TaxID=78828 RepID=UPI0009E1FA90|nr:probable magnesium transporter NIPA9 isoform X2 [Phalaenopsis equestris]
MWESICLTLMATAGNNIGKVLQKKGTVVLPPLSLRPKVSIIQPVSGCGLAILAVFSHFYLKEVMNSLDWIGIVLAGIGTIGVGAGGKEQSPTVSLLRLPWLVFSISILFIVLNAWLHIYKSKRLDQELMNYEVVEEIISGLESGILFGFSSALSKLGFVLSEQGFSKMLVPICILISICCSAFGFICQTRGLKHGRAIVVSTCAAVASIVTGVLAGMFALGESLPSAPVARLSLLLGWLLIISGIILLVCSARIMSILPRPLRRLLRSSKERNHKLRRSFSARPKEASPNAVIHASTLHHLMSSSAVKENS